jgi:hypothetical protein
VASTLLYEIAKKKGIRTINIDMARIGNRTVFSEDDRTLTWVKQRFDEIRGGMPSEKRSEAIAYLEEFRGHPAPYDINNLPEFYADGGRSVVFRFLDPKKLLKTVPWHIKALIVDMKKMRNRDYNDIFVWWSLWDKLKRKARILRGFSGVFTQPDLNASFAYLPLHTDPEISTMRYAPYYAEMRPLIKAAARSLPVGMLLYVKEHPGMSGYRPRSYYEELLKIPNVRIIGPHYPGGELCKYAKLIITATSTIAWEGMVLKKPIITFGDAFFNDIPGVRRCVGFNDLPFAVKEQLESWKHDEDTLVDYVSALLEDSIPVGFNVLWNNAAPYDEVLSDGGMKQLSALLAKKIGIVAA